MQLTIVLVFALNIFGVQSGCFHHYGPAWGWQYSTNHRNYQCVQQEKCFDNQYNLNTIQRQVTQNGRCDRFGRFVVGYICCLHKSPPPRRSPNLHTRTPSRNPPSRPMTISSHKPNNRQQPQPEQPSTIQISPQAQKPSLPLRPQSPTSSPISPSQNANCRCIQQNKCNDKQISNDQLIQESCPSPNEVCCHNLIQPSSTTSRNPSILSQTQPQGLPEGSPSTNDNCNCIPTRECFDEDSSSNPFGLLDNQNNNRPLRQESCPNTNHVCCHNLVQPLSTPTRNPSPQPQSPRPFQISTQRPTVGPSPRPQSPRPFQISTQRPTVGPSPRPQSPSPAQISSSPSSNCLCTPFYKCYDEETSSNLTGIVNDRSFSPVVEQRACLNSNEICCHNLVKPMVKPTTVSSFEDCSGSCVSINECPNLLNILNAARKGKSDAIQELRNLVCSITGSGQALVCCHQKGVVNPFGVIFRNN